jgi:hypothetical protein
MQCSLAFLPGKPANDHWRLTSGNKRAKPLEMRNMRRSLSFYSEWPERQSLSARKAAKPRFQGKAAKPRPDVPVLSRKPETVNDVRSTGM